MKYKFCATCSERRSVLPVRNGSNICKGSVYCGNGNKRERKIINYCTTLWSGWRERQRTLLELIFGLVAGLKVFIWFTSEFIIFDTDQQINSWQTFKSQLFWTWKSCNSDVPTTWRHSQIRPTQTQWNVGEFRSKPLLLCVQHKFSFECRKTFSWMCHKMILSDNVPVLLPNPILLYARLLLNIYD